jgi:hypothetical protein
VCTVQHHGCLKKKTCILPFICKVCLRIATVTYYNCISAARKFSAAMASAAKGKLLAVIGDEVCKNLLHYLHANEWLSFIIIIIIIYLTARSKF